MSGGAGTSLGPGLSVSQLRLRHLTYGRPGQRARTRMPHAWLHRDCRRQHRRWRYRDPPETRRCCASKDENGRVPSAFYPGEIIAAVRALVRTFESAGSDIHALADHVEKPNSASVPEAEMKRPYDPGYSAGVLAAESWHHGVGDFHNTDGKPDWDAVALFLQRNKRRLDSRHHEFIDDMASRTVWGREPTEKQHRWWENPSCLPELAFARQRSLTMCVR
jgi:hypothetical protein